MKKEIIQEIWERILSKGSGEWNKDVKMSDIEQILKDIERENNLPPIQFYVKHIEKYIRGEREMIFGFKGSHEIIFEIYGFVDWEDNQLFTPVMLIAEDMIIRENLLLKNVQEWFTLDEEYICVVFKDGILARYHLEEQKLLWKTDVSYLNLSHLSMDFYLHFIERVEQNDCYMLADFKEKVIYYYDKNTGEYIGKSKIINEVEMIWGEYEWTEKQ